MSSGFKLFKLSYIVSDATAEGVTVENGKIYNSNGTFGYTEDKYGVKACLEDFCKPLVRLEDNGEGWQIDTSLCPNSEAILLKPNVSVYAMFFKHQSGARLMLGLNYWGMVSTSTSTYQTITDDSGWSIGFLGTKTQVNKGNPSSSASTNNVYIMGGGIFMSMIPSAGDGEEQEVFNPSVSIQNELFYSAHMTPIQYQRVAYIEGAFPTYMPMGTSLIKTGTNDSTAKPNGMPLKSKVYGALIGSKVTLDLLVCNDIIGNLYTYKGYCLGFQFCGNILSNLRSQSDNNISSRMCLLTRGCSDQSASSSSVHSGQCWHTGTYSYHAQNKCCDETGLKYVFATNDCDDKGYTLLNNNLIYLFPCFVKGCDSTNPVSLTDQAKGLLNQDLFRITNKSDFNGSIGNRYCNSEWCHLGKMSLNYDYTIKTNHTFSLPLFIKWNKEFNGNTSLY